MAERFPWYSNLPLSSLLFIASNDGGISLYVFEKHFAATVNVKT